MALSAEFIGKLPGSLFRRNSAPDVESAVKRREAIVVRDAVNFLTQDDEKQIMELPGEPYPQKDTSLSTDKNAGLTPDQITTYFGAQIAEIVNAPTPPLAPSADIYLSEKAQNATLDSLANNK